MIHQVYRRVLITGGAGFVGSHLTRQLLEQNFEVVVVDNFSNGRRDNIIPFLSSSQFELMEGDITDASFIKESIGSFAPQIIYHLAAVHFIPYCVAHPKETLQVNVVGTQQILEAIGLVHPSRFILASTNDVYIPSDIPHTESDPLGSPNIYGTSKLFCEHLIRLAENLYPDTRFLIARFFNIFGPGDTSSHVLPHMLSSLKDGNLLRLGNMQPQRDYIYVNDVVQALLQLVTYQGDEKIFNVGTGIGRSVWDLVEALRSITGLPIRVKTDYTKVRAMERQKLVADISLALRELKWAPSVSFEQGLKETIASAEFTKRIGEIM